MDASLLQVDDVLGKLDDIYNSLLAEVDEEGQGLTDMFMVSPDAQVGNALVVV